MTVFFIVFFETFIAQPESVLEAIFEFLGVQADSAHDIRLEQKNPFAMPRNKLSRQLLASPTTRDIIRTVVPRPVRMFMREKILLQKVAKPEMDPAARDFLTSKFKNEMSCLERLVGERPPWD